MEFTRTLDISKLTSSIFLFGARQTGKTYLVKNTTKPDLYIDLLKKEELIRYTMDSALISKEIQAINKKNLIVVLDEVQKVPHILDEIHLLIESELKPIFILTGSSARKLKRNQANLLGGRAITEHLYPLSFIEIKNDQFSLNKYLVYGGLPKVVSEKSTINKIKLLKSYVNTYLKEEIYDESLTRNLPAFTQFLELSAFENGNIINYSTLARELGVSSKIIKEYFSILEDTLIGFFLPPFKKSHRKRIITHPKFYYFDTGIVSALKKMLTIEIIEKTSLYGECFEHFIILETIKAVKYLGEEINFFYFRTYDRAEVDLILEKHGRIIPIEIKSSKKPTQLKGLKSFMKDHKFYKSICVCKTPRSYIESEIYFMPWQDYILHLYEQNLFQ